MLHVTNGDAAVAVMRKAGITGEILPWRDVLHEGLVPAGLPLEALSEVRAEFIADCGWAAADAAKVDFRSRDAILARFREHEAVTLWFEHDLYDQLQLLQLLDFFSGRDPGSTQLGLICVDEYLGTLTPARMAALQALKQPLSSSQLALGRAAWAAFRSPLPDDWAALLDQDTSALPFLAGAVLRHLEQYPSAANGLNRTETQLLQAVRAGIPAPGGIFEASQKAEERVFMGDTTFWLYLQAMTRSGPPLLEAVGGDVRITGAGERMLDGDLDWIAVNGIDKWLGGVRLAGNRFWRWDGKARRLREDKA